MIRSCGVENVLSARTWLEAKILQCFFFLGGASVLFYFFLVVVVVLFSFTFFFLPLCRQHTIASAINTQTRTRTDKNVGEIKVEQWRNHLLLSSITTIIAMECQWEQIQNQVSVSQWISVCPRDKTIGQLNGLLFFCISWINATKMVEWIFMFWISQTIIIIY